MPAAAPGFLRRGNGWGESVLLSLAGGSIWFDVPTLFLTALALIGAFASGMLLAVFLSPKGRRPGTAGGEKALTNEV